MRWLLALLLACDATSPPLGQIAVQIDTDAPISPELFDAMRIDVYPPGASEPCAECSRTFGVDEAQFRAGDVTFGVPSPSGRAGYIARVRLYPLRATLSGEPPARGSPSVIDVFARLPPAPAEGIVWRKLFLETERVGTTESSLDAPVETGEGRFERSRVGSWTGTRAVPCAGAPRDGEVCVPGGAFFMGNARAWELTPEGAQIARTSLRLVVLSPFFLDADLVSVARFRAAGFSANESRAGGQGDAFADFCTFTQTPGPFEDHPVNCVTWTLATEYCRARGAELVSEAQIERVASAGDGRTYPWGDDPTLDCSAVTFGRVGWGFLRTAAPCMPSTPFGGPLAVGSAVEPPRRDRVTLEGGTVFDLAGNMTTFTADRWNRGDQPCWSRSGPYVDPVCDGAGVDRDLLSIRGGGWHMRTPAPAAQRGSIRNSTIAITTGVRCSRAAR